MDGRDASAVEAVARRLATDTGMTFEGQRRMLLHSRLEECARSARTRGLAEFVESLLAENPPGELWRGVLDAVVTDETSWFRYENQFRTLRDFAMPVLVSNKSFSGERSLRVLSAGCSRGHEPYSIAIALAEMAPPAGGLAPGILAVDLSDAAVRYARRGHYSDVEMRGMPRDLRERYFSRSDSGWRLAEEVRRGVEFRQQNLLAPLPPESFDLVFCRNVTIYFERATADRVLSGLVRALAPGGYLFVGHAEVCNHVSPELKTVQVGDATVYRRVARSAQPERVQ